MVDDEATKWYCDHPSWNKQHAPIKWGRRSDFSSPHILKLPTSDLARHFYSLSKEITKSCSISKVSREERELRSTSLLRDGLTRGGPAFRAGFPFQMLNKVSLYLNENTMLRMWDDPETAYSLFQLCLALFSTASKSSKSVTLFFPQGPSARLSPSARLFTHSWVHRYVLWFNPGTAFFTLESIRNVSYQLIIH